MKNKIKQKLLITERKLLLKIFGLNTLTDGSWRITIYEELHELIKRNNTAREIKSRRIAWF
jgi:hypothetical protein